MMNDEEEERKNIKHKSKARHLKHEIACVKQIQMTKRQMTETKTAATSCFEF
ncbi:MAG: hypothetical protein MUF15_21820 [Acidobacteria bacterium]|jgi:hypothetical protein|nr:hypothetical protein [Acidobacteriota bacterium]